MTLLFWAHLIPITILYYRTQRTCVNMIFCCSCDARHQYRLRYETATKIRVPLQKKEALLVPKLLPTKKENAPRREQARSSTHTHTHTQEKRAGRHDRDPPKKRDSTAAATYPGRHPHNINASLQKLKLFLKNRASVGAPPFRRKKTWPTRHFLYGSLRYAWNDATATVRVYVHVQQSLTDACANVFV